ARVRHTFVAKLFHLYLVRDQVPGRTRLPGRGVFGRGSLGGDEELAVGALEAAIALGGAVDQFRGEGLLAVRTDDLERLGTATAAPGHTLVGGGLGGGGSHSATVAKRPRPPQRLPAATATRPRPTRSAPRRAAGPACPCRRARWCRRCPSPT